MADALPMKLLGHSTPAVEQPGNQIDPESGEVTAELAIGGSPLTGVEAWAGDDAVHVRRTTPWMVTIDPATNEIATTHRRRARPGALTVGFDSIWTVNLEHDNVFRLTP
jgi:hypothetical protein